MGKSDQISKYLAGKDTTPLFLVGDALSQLKKFPDNSVDCVVTSPPYWGKREYSGGGIGLEVGYQEFISNLLKIFEEVKRVLCPSGSVWLNIGDTYSGKRLLGIPWRVAIQMCDEQGWILRNEVIWNKVKGGPDNSKDKLGNVHEQIFHFVKKPHYYYNDDAIRSKPGSTKVVNGAIVSATGVTGIRYKRQIQLSKVLSESEKKRALSALRDMLDLMGSGGVSDFRMIIRGEQRSTHSDSVNLSGRAKELKEKGFYFLKYHKNGSKPRDVWDILPEDTQKRGDHYAAYPADLCKIPILATCPPSGVVLDPFVGTGTTSLVAQSLGRKSVGIDISARYVGFAKNRCKIGGR